MTDVRIGVVSYKETKFQQSQSESGLGTQLERALTRLNVSAQVRVSTEDRGDIYGIEVTPRTVQASLDEQWKIQRRWTNFLQRRGYFGQLTYNVPRLFYRATQRLKAPVPSTITRLLNIEASHRDLLAWGFDGDARWVLILEDDAMSTDVEDLAKGLQGIVHGRRTPAYANLSDSFTSSQLGVDHLLTRVEDVNWEGRYPRAILQSTLPVSNTVCAVLYRADFARRLSEAYEDLPVEPVLPIDWKFNAALMLMHERSEIEPNECWQVEPAPIVQMSMR